MHQVGNQTTTPKWSTIVPNTGTPTSTPIYRSYNSDISPSLGAHGCQTLYEALRRGASINPLGPCLGFRAISTSGFATPFIYSTYTEILARVNCISAGLDDLGLVKKNEDGLLLLGLYMKNCMEWTISEHAIYTIGGATVPFYDTLGPDTVSFILNQTNLSVCVCTRAEVSKLVEAKNTNQCPCFQYIIVVDGIIPSIVEMTKNVGLVVYSLAFIETHGSNKLSSSSSSIINKAINNNSDQYSHHHPPKGSDIATFCYTSGTTGNPKGALLTHTNLLSAISGMNQFFTPEINLTDRHLSYLPLPHIFERVVQAQILLSGGSVGFFRGDPLHLLEDIQACRPTILPVAPRVLNKIHDKIMAGMTSNSVSPVKRSLFNMALRAKRENLNIGISKHGLYDALIFNKIKKALGMDCIRLMVSGSAPLSEHVMTFFRCLLGVPVIEGYGQTEGAAAATIGHPEDIASVGHVGGPVGCVEICLVDVEDMNYFHTDTHHRGKPCRGRGEIWVRGPSVFKGYYKDDEKTRETVDENGWLHSGDIGLWTLDGALQIIDRKKNIFKLAQGEYVAAEKIENILTQSLFISQCFVYGDSFQSALVAIVVPDEEIVKKWAAESGETSLQGADMKTLCASQTLNNLIMNEIKRLAKENRLQGFEIPKSIYLEAAVFTTEKDLVTPTFKLKRPQLKNYYQKVIDDMYEKMPPPPSKL